jgi:chain length determinant protein tyrosine kinase EpsG
MGKRESTVLAAPPLEPAHAVWSRLRAERAAAHAAHSDEPAPEQRSIGELMRELRGFDEQQVEQIVALQRQRRLRFGEAAVALQLASEQDVLWALSQQHAHCWAPQDESALDASLVMARQPFSRQAEHFRTLRGRLLGGVLASGPVRRALAVASVGRGEGKSYFAANLAISLSQLGARTLLIDADLRTPRLHGLFGLPNDSGLSHVLARRQQGQPSILGVSALPRLFVMPSGTLPPNPADLVQRETFDALLQEMLATFEHVIVDTPAASQGCDCTAICTKTGAALVVAQRDACPLPALQSLLQELSQHPVYLAGVLLNEHRGR